VKQFIYSGGKMNKKGTSVADVKRRVVLAPDAMKRLHTLGKTAHIRESTKLEIGSYDTFVQC